MLTDLPIKITGRTAQALRKINTDIGKEDLSEYRKYTIEVVP